MSKTKRSLTTSDVKALVTLNRKQKESKKEFDDAKAELCPDSVAEGKYMVEGVGCVQKVAIIQTVVDYKKLIADHPKIDIEKYTTYKEAPRILIFDFQNEKDTKSFFGKFLKH